MFLSWRDNKVEYKNKNYTCFIKAKSQIRIMAEVISQLKNKHYLVITDWMERVLTIY